MHKIISFFKRKFKNPGHPMQDEVTNALLSYKIAQEKDFKEKQRKLRYVRPKESIELGNIALKQFLVNHKMLSNMGERTVLHELNLGVYGKPGSAKYDYVSAWLKDVEYERLLDHTDETNGIARDANKAAEEANALARRALLTARISAAIAFIALIAAMIIKTP